MADPPPEDYCQLMSEHRHDERLTSEDRHVVDLAATALVDPNLHTDLRMRLNRDITERLRAAHEELYSLGVYTGPIGHDEQSSLELLRAALVDPNMPTDVRMRLHREISELVRATEERAAAGEEQSG